MDALSQAVARLLKTMEEMERRLANVEKALGISPAEPGSAQLQRHGVEPQTAPAAPVPAQPEPPLELTPSQPSGSPVLETRLGLTWINRVGVVTLVLGAAFFFKYVVDNRWIGETGRVVLGVAAGFAALVIAQRTWLGGHKVYAQGICGAGIAILYLSFYASFAFYHLLPQAPVFLLMALTTAVAGALAVRYCASAVLVLGLLGGYSTPVLLSTGEDRPWFLFSYVLLLNVGALAVAKSRKWRWVEVLAFLATVLLYASWFTHWYTPEKQAVATFFALVYYAVFTLVNLSGVLAALQVCTLIGMLAIWSPNLTYLSLALALSAAALFVADLRDRPVAATAAFGAFWLCYAAWCAALPEPKPVLEIFLALTAAFLLFFGWLPWRLLARRAAASRQDLLLLALNGVVYFGACYSLLQVSHKAHLGLFAAVVGVIHLAMGVWLWKRLPEATRDPRPVVLSVGLALGFLTLAAPIQFSGYRITIAWATEAAALAWIGVHTATRRLVHASLLVFLLTLIRLCFIDARIYPEPASYHLFANVRFLTFLVAAVCFWGAARWIRAGWATLGTYVAGHLVMLWTLGLEVLGWAARTAAVENLDSVKSASLSILIAAYALVLVGIGVVVRSGVNRILGLALLALVVLKLYLYDVWLLKRIYRVAAFAVLGILLLVTSYVYSRHRSSIENWWRKEKAD